MSRDSEQDYFVDGLTEDIITALSYWRMFPVIARNSTFVYKGRAVNVQQIATELGAKYVIEGSGPQSRRSSAGDGPAHRCRNRPSRLGRTL